MPKPVQIGAATVLHGDCVALMSALGPVDAIVTDPPYGLEFMGVVWDKMRENGTPRTRNEWGDFGNREHARRPIENGRISRNTKTGLLDDVPGALWSRERIEEARWAAHKNVPELIRIVVAIDPAASHGEEADETGIVVAGKDRNGHGYVLADRSARYPPTEWARTAISLYGSYKADRIVAERNNGGDMVEATIRMVNANVSYAKVHASRGKVMRAEPVAALYEQHRVHHVGAFPTLEDQQCGFAVT